MTVHTKDALRGPSISQVFNLSLAVPTSEARGAESLVAGENGQVLNLVSTRAAAICAVVANEGAVAKEEEVRVGIEERAASIATEAVEMPSVTGCETVSYVFLGLF